MLDYLIVVVIFLLFLLLLVHFIDFFFLWIIGSDQIFHIALPFFLGILISTWYLFFFLLLATLSSQASRSSLDHRDYQLLAPGLVEDEYHVDEPNVCHKVCLVLLGL